jgi:hypothetical protein
VSESTTHNKMFAQWWGDVLAQSAIFVQRLVMWDNEAFQNPTTTQTQTLCASPPNEKWAPKIHYIWTWT